MGDTQSTCDSYYIVERYNETMSTDSSVQTMEIVTEPYGSLCLKFNRFLVAKTMLFIPERSELVAILAEILTQTVIKPCCCNMPRACNRRNDSSKFQFLSRISLMLHLRISVTRQKCPQTSSDSHLLQEIERILL